MKRWIWIFSWLSPSASSGFRTNTTGFLTFGNMLKNSSDTRDFPYPVPARRKVLSPFTRLTTVFIWSSFGSLKGYLSRNLIFTAFFWSSMLECRSVLDSVGFWSSRLRVGCSRLRSVLRTSKCVVLRVCLLYMMNWHENNELVRKFDSFQLSSMLSGIVNRG